MGLRSYALVILALLACSSSASDPTALDQPIAQNIVINEVAILQTLKVPIMKDGAPVDRGTLPLVALRDSVLRVYVTPGDGWSPHSITARAKIVTSAPTGGFAQVFSASQIISDVSTEKDLGSTINIPITGVALEPGSSFVVVLNDDTGDSPTVASSDARYPQDGSLADLAVQDGGDVLRVMIVPVQYNADGSGRLPDTGDTQLQAYHDLFYKLYPAATVEISVHDPWPWNSFIDPSGAGFDTVLNAIGKLRATDQPDADIYYYGALAPASDFGSFCGGSCVSGLSPIGAPYSVGLGYFGDASTETAVHEVGHAHGREHAPCGGASQPDPKYPYPNAELGSWGYDSTLQYMVDPTAFKDMMSYCSPTWISDYHYSLIFTRVRTDNRYYADQIRRPAARAMAPRFFVGHVDGAGNITPSLEASREPWITQGEPREIGNRTGYYFPYDHLPGGVLYMPDDAP